MHLQVHKGFSVLSCCCCPCSRDEKYFSVYLRVANIDGELVKINMKSKLILFSFLTHILGLIVNDSPVHVILKEKKNCLNIITFKKNVNFSFLKRLSRSADSICAGYQLMLTNSQIGIIVDYRIRYNNTAFLKSCHQLTQQFNAGLRYNKSYGKNSK